MACLLLAGAGLSTFSYWVDRFAALQAHEEVTALANRKIALAEDRLDRLIEILGDLRQRGMNSCDPPQLQMLRQTALSVSVIKELAVTGPDGQTLCSTLGPATGERKLLSSQQVANPEVTLEVVAMSDANEKMLRIRLSGPADASGLAIMILGSRVISHRSQASQSGDGYGAAKLQDGTLIGESGDPEAIDATAGRFTISRTSARYGIEFTASLAKAKRHGEVSRLELFGFGIFGAVAAMLLAMLFLLPRRQRENPIAELERALDAGEFVPYYQPIVDLVSGKLRGAEVLIRWRKPDGSTVSPAAFIPLAESSGIIIEMTQALMRRVCQEVGPAFAERQHLKICFNLAARHFRDDGIVRDVREIFGRSQVRLSQVVLELTERQPIENLAETRRLIAILQGLGVRMAIDDVGTGHAGLSYILKLGVDIIKIDKMFIDAIGIDRSSTTIIETLIDLAHNMRMDIVAEGVETFEQVVCLRERGIRAAQGFVFAPPLPGASFLQLIEAIEPLGAAVGNADATRAA